MTPQKLPKPGTSLGIMSDISNPVWNRYNPLFLKKSLNAFYVFVQDNPGIKMSTFYVNPLFELPK